MRGYEMVATDRNLVANDSIPAETVRKTICLQYVVMHMHQFEPLYCGFQSITTGLQSDETIFHPSDYSSIDLIEFDYEIILF